MNTTEYLQTWSDSYKNDMISNIMPFWMKYGWDRKNGGVYTCLDRDGSLIDTTKSVWFQGRFAFTCSYAYNHIEQNPEWLAAAKSTIDFIVLILMGVCFLKLPHRESLCANVVMSFLKLLQLLLWQNMLSLRVKGNMRKRL